MKGRHYREKDGAREKERERGGEKDISSTCSLLNWPQLLCENQEPIFHLDLPRVLHDPKDMGHFLLLS